MGKRDISAKVIGDMILFAEAAEREGWHEGTDLRRPDMAVIVGIGLYDLHTVVRTAKEYPDLGISVSTKRGAKPYTVVTTKKERISDDTMGVVRQISESKASENLKRTVRDVSTSYLAWKRSNRGLTESRKTKPYANTMQKFLYEIRMQAVGDGDPFEVREMAEQALALVGIRFDDEETGNGVVS